MKRIVVWLSVCVLLSGCAKETEGYDREKVLELLQAYYSPYYVEESGIIENSDGEAYDSNIEMYDVCEDYNEESDLAGEKIYEVKVNLATGEAQELSESGSVMDSFNFYLGTYLDKISVSFLVVLFILEFVIPSNL